MSTMICEVCGNDLPSVQSVCPFCGHRQPLPSSPDGKPSPILTINLKRGMPASETAISRLVQELETARSSGAKIVRVIHGYGSGGKGGLIAQDARRKLQSLQNQRMIRKFVPGEDYSRSTVAGRTLLHDHPALAEDERTDRNNPGITLVVL